MEGRTTITHDRVNIEIEVKSSCEEQSFCKAFRQLLIRLKVLHFAFNPGKDFKADG